MFVKNIGRKGKKKIQTILLECLLKYWREKAEEEDTNHSSGMFVKNIGEKRRKNEDTNHSSGMFVKNIGEKSRKKKIQTILLECLLKILVSRKKKIQTILLECLLKILATEEEDTNHSSGMFVKNFAEKGGRRRHKPFFWNVC
ncbi:hypothetical protein CDAR_301971 [Caerostris darwini]|uniref:Uncharacterized protein n=1 Tax=Caerostris darwini TaxID=1538125 RepID=A0AAV4UGR5_9ARAC|nr:hypothetical protein CDAR_301971 [Caerostris darwini]